MKLPVWKFLLIVLLAIALFAGVNKTNANTNIDTACKMMRVSDCTLVKAIAKVESNFNPKAITYDNMPNYGMMQIQCPTAKSVGFKGSCSELFNPSTNLRYGIKYIYWLRDNLITEAYYPAILSAYNAGLWRGAKICENRKCRYSPRFCFDFRKDYIVKGQRSCYAGEYINENYVNKVMAAYAVIQK